MLLHPHHFLLIFIQLVSNYRLISGLSANGPFEMQNFYFQRDSEGLIIIDLRDLIMDNPNLVLYNHVIQSDPRIPVTIDMELHYTQRVGIRNDVTEDVSFTYQPTERTTTVLEFDLDPVKVRSNTFLVIETDISGTHEWVDWVYFMTGSVPGTQVTIPTVHDIYYDDGFRDISFRSSGSGSIDIFDILTSSQFVPVEYAITFGTYHLPYSNVRVSINDFGDENHDSVLLYKVSQYNNPNTGFEYTFSPHYLLFYRAGENISVITDFASRSNLFFHQTIHGTPIYDVSNSVTLTADQVLIPAYHLYSVPGFQGAYTIECTVVNPYNVSTLTGNSLNYQDFTETNSPVFEFTYTPVQERLPLPQVPFVTGGFGSINFDLITGGGANIFTDIVGDPFIQTGAPAPADQTGIHAGEVLVPFVLPDITGIGLPSLPDDIVSLSRVGTTLSLSALNQNFTSKPICQFESTLLVQDISHVETYEPGSSINDDDYTVTVPVNEADPIQISCEFDLEQPDGTISKHAYLEKSVATKPAFVDIISEIQDNRFGWGGGNLLGIGFMGVMVILSAMAGFNRVSLPASMIVSVSVITLAAFFGLITIPQYVITAVIVIAILGIFQRGHR